MVLQCLAMGIHPVSSGKPALSVVEGIDLLSVVGCLLLARLLQTYITEVGFSRIFYSILDLSTLRQRPTDGKVNNAYKPDVSHSTEFTLSVAERAQGRFLRST